VTPTPKPSRSHGHLRAAPPVTLTVGVTVEQCWHRVPGGTATSVLTTLEALRRTAGLDFVGVSAWHTSPPPRAFEPPIRVRMLGLPRNLLYEAWHWLRWPSPTWATGPVDVLWATGMVVPPTKGPLVVTVHDLHFLDHPERFTRRGQWLFRRFWRLTRRHADVVVCPSEATRRDCVARGIDEQRVRVVPWSVATPRATDADVDAVRERHGLQAPYVLWVGTVEPRKNLSAVVRAWRRLHDAGSPAELVLVGPPGWQENLDALLGADRSGIHVLGFVDAPDLAALYRGAEALCYPSRAEGFGLPVLEAMAQGTPVVTSAGTATAEVAGPDADAGFLVDPDDVTAIAHALDSILADPALRHRMGTAASQRAAWFTPTRTAEGMEAAFRAAVGARG